MDSGQGREPEESDSDGETARGWSSSWTSASEPPAPSEPPTDRDDTEAAPSDAEPTDDAPPVDAEPTDAAPRIIEDPLADAPTGDRTPVPPQSTIAGQPAPPPGAPNDPGAATPTPPPPPAGTAPPPAHAAPQPSDPPAVAHDDAARSDDTRGDRSLTNLWIVLGLVAVTGLAAWWFLRPKPVPLTHDDVPITNAEAVLRNAESRFDQVVAADESLVHEDSSCWLGPGIDDPEPSRVFCGPVVLGIDTQGHGWLAGEVSWSTSGESATGEFRGFDGPAPIDPNVLRRPDDVSPPDVQLDQDLAGIRTAEGARITNAEDFLADLEQSLRTLADEQGAATNDQTACWLDATTAAGRTTLNGGAWCGPILTLDSNPDQPWVRIDTSTSDGDLLSTAVLDEPFSTSLRTEALAPDGDLYRPDDRPIPDRVDLALPNADPIEPGTVLLLDEPLGEVALTAPDDGVLRTDAMQVRFTGLARVPIVGAGPDAIVAPDGHDLVVAELAVRPLGDDFFPDAGTGTLVVDGRRVPLDDWRFVGEDTTALVVVVEESAEVVELEVLAADLSQRISLLDGAKVGDWPRGQYRDQQPVGVGAALSGKLQLPSGDPASATVTVTSARLTGHVDDVGWADPDRAFLVLELDDVDVDTPCCELLGVQVTATPSLLRNGEPVAPVLADRSTVVFDVPADTTTARFGLTIRAQWGDDEQAQRQHRRSVEVTFP